MKYKSIFLSDIHLGTKFSKAEIFLDFLKKVESENIFLIGDIIDGWAIKRKFKWPQSHSDVIQKLLRASRKGVNIYYIIGNHDDFLRPFVPLVLGDRIQIVNELEYISLKKKRYYIVHGDFFDSITMTKKWLAHLGDIGYDLLLNINVVFSYIRQKIGYKKYWSLSKYVKDNVKQSVNFINDYENILSEYAHKNKYDGVICGHIHKAEIKMVDTIEYMNSGDWVESCTVLVERFDGEFEIIHWQ
ncbi:MAG: serine/threonine protein phosphatase [Sulfurovum sp. AS07-7]|nr:MAG: serine/threonine protein phosphatase [Sulfurovum sp. AS07-7]